MCLSLSLLQARPEGKGFVAGAVVGHHASDRHAEAVVIGDGGLEEGDRALRLSSGMIMVKAMREASSMQDVDELPAGALTSGPCVALPPAVAGDAVADLVEAAELLMSTWISSPGCWHFVAQHRLGRLEGLQAAQAAALRCG